MKVINLKRFAYLTIVVSLISNFPAVSSDSWEKIIENPSLPDFLKNSQSAKPLIQISGTAFKESDNKIKKSDNKRNISINTNLVETEIYSQDGKLKAKKLGLHQLDQKLKQTLKELNKKNNKKNFQIYDVLNATLSELDSFREILVSDKDLSWTSTHIPFKVLGNKINLGQNYTFQAKQENIRFDGDHIYKILRHLAYINVTNLWKYTLWMKEIIFPTQDARNIEKYQANIMNRITKEVKVHEIELASLTQHLNLLNDSQLCQDLVLLFDDFFESLDNSNSKIFDGRVMMQEATNAFQKILSNQKNLAILTIKKPTDRQEKVATQPSIIPKDNRIVQQKQLNKYTPYMNNILTFFDKSEKVRAHFVYLIYYMVGSITQGDFVKYNKSYNHDLKEMLDHKFLFSDWKQEKIIISVNQPFKFNDLIKMKTKQNVIVDSSGALQTLSIEKQEDYILNNRNYFEKTRKTHKQRRRIKTKQKIIINNNKTINNNNDKNWNTNNKKKKTNFEIYCEDLAKKLQKEIFKKSGKLKKKDFISALKKLNFKVEVNRKGNGSQHYVIPSPNHQYFGKGSDYDGAYISIHLPHKEGIIPHPYYNFLKAGFRNIFGVEL